MFDQKKLYGILGMARSGIAAAYKIKMMGGRAFLSDLKSQESIPEADKIRSDFDCEFGIHSDKLLSCDEWIVSPGIPLNAPIINKGKSHGIKMISELEFGFQIKAKDSKLIAVTGSNGKSTTASLIAHIIKESGKECILAGNIGDAFCGFRIEQDGIDFIVLEVSSFQLDLIDSFRPDIALLLNITPDHLNRYDTFLDYARSKMNIFSNQTQKDFAVLNADDAIINKLEKGICSNRRYFSLNSDESLVKPDLYIQGKSICSTTAMNFINTDELQIKGPHNWANSMAAILACQAAGLTDGSIKYGLRSFKALDHRLQYVDTINGISFYNDSKATNTDSVKYALLSFEHPIRIIMGGSDKGEDFSVLTDLLAQRARKVYLTGATAASMNAAWKNHMEVAVIEDFGECVKAAFLEAQPGDIVVLSPACASYDRFRNFEHRGQTFIDIVKKLAGSYEKK
jgi:UDP-N-acetylmuramoylalanine--D-glutamate ligase